MNMKGEENYHAKYEKWSSLPCLLLWMIKDRLDYPNSVRFTSVCKHWLHASESYSPYSKDDFELDNTPPWIMSYNKANDSKREFENLLTGERYIIDNPHFISSFVLYSCRGWILLMRLKSKYGKFVHNYLDTTYESPYLLFNPFKNMSIELPFLDVTLGAGAFDMQDGKPNGIILVSICCPIHLYITHRGDQSWLHYTFEGTNYMDHRNDLYITWVFIIGQLVHIMTLGPRVFIFDITNQQWMSLKMENLSLQSEQYLVERRGEILRFHIPESVRKEDRDISKANCYKLNINGENSNWEPFDASILGRTCFWYLSAKFGRSFVTEVNNADEFARLRKALKKKNPNAKKKAIKTLVLSRYMGNSTWVHLG